MNWTLVFTARAKKDAKKLASSGLKAQAQRLLDVLAETKRCQEPFCLGLLTRP